MFDRSNRRLSFQSLRNCFVICQRSSKLVVCFSIFVLPVLLLKYLLLDPFSTLLGLFLRHSLSRFLNPSRCSDQPRLPLFSAAADDHPNFLALDHHELLHVLTSSSSSSLVLETRLFWAFLSMALVVSPGLTVAFLNISALPLSVSHGNPLYFSMVTCLVVRLECVSPLWT